MRVLLVDFIVQTGLLEPCDALTAVLRYTLTPYTYLVLLELERMFGMATPEVDSA